MSRSIVEFYGGPFDGAAYSIPDFQLLGNENPWTMLKTWAFGHVAVYVLANGRWTYVATCRTKKAVGVAEDYWKKAVR
jgi:hypothetical protein